MAIRPIRTCTVFKYRHVNLELITIRIITDI